MIEASFEDIQAVYLRWKRGELTTDQFQYFLSKRDPLLLSNLRDTDPRLARQTGTSIRGSGWGTGGAMDEIDPPLIFSIANYKGMVKPQNFGMRAATRGELACLAFPIPPESFEISGSNSAEQVVSASGRTFTHAGPREPQQISWEGILPHVENGMPWELASLIPMSVRIRGLINPPKFCRMIENAMHAGQPVKLVIQNGRTEDKQHPVIYSAPVTIVDFSWSIRAGHGLDRFYSITFQEWSEQDMLVRRTPARRPAGGGNGGGKGVKYTIKSGDTLWGIAKAYYNGQGGKWPVIYERNKEVLNEALEARDQALNNPDLIYPGTNIIIPALN